MGEVLVNNVMLLLGLEVKKGRGWWWGEATERERDVDGLYGGAWWRSENGVQGRS